MFRLFTRFGDFAGCRALPFGLSLITKTKSLVPKWLANNSALASVFGSNIATTLLATLAGILVARTFGAGGRGLIAAVMTWAAVSRALVEFGVPQAITYRIGLVRGRIDDIAPAAGTLALMQGFLVALITLALSCLLPYEYRVVARYIVLIGAVSPFVLFSTYVGSAALGAAEFRVCNRIRIFNGTAPVLAAAVAATLDQAFSTFIVTLVALQATIGLVLATTYIPFDHVLRRRTFHEITDLLSYGRRSYWGNLSWQANARIDQAVMPFFIEPARLGLYAVAVSISSLVLPLAGAVANVLFSEIARTPNREFAGAWLRQRIRVGITACIALAVVLMLVSPILVPLVFGQAFRAAVPIAIAMIGAGVLLGVNYILSDAIRGMGAPEVPSRAEIAGLLSTVLILAILLPIVNVWGAVIASWASYSIVAIILVTSLHSRLPSSEQLRPSGTLHPGEIK